MSCLSVYGICIVAHQDGPGWGESALRGSAARAHKERYAVSHGNLVCKIELSKTGGITVMVTNEDDKITQTFSLNGKTIETSCKGQDGESKITQTPKSVAISCDDFSVDAKTVKVTAKESISEESDGTFGLKSKDAFTLDSQKTLAMDSQDSMSASGKSVTLKANSGALNASAASDIVLKGQNATVQGSMAATLKGTNVEASGSAKASIQGQMVSVSGSQISLG